MIDKINEVKSILLNSKVVAITGAGISTESGIPDFRGNAGRYVKYEKLSPIDILSLPYYRSHCSEFYNYFYSNFDLDNIKPNEGHYFLANLEELGTLKLVVTQNIDTLHEMSGSKSVYHTHGVYNSGHCEDCGKSYSLNDMKKKGTIPKCDDPECMGIIKTDVTLYWEDLPFDYYQARYSISNPNFCETLLIMGTTLSTQDTVELVKCFKGKNIIIINDTKIDKMPEVSDDINIIFIQGRIGEIIKQLNIEDSVKKLKRY